VVISISWLASLVLTADGHMDDMTGLPELSENSILKNLQTRYKKEIIYTYTGTILVASNPYKWIPIYEDVRPPSLWHLPLLNIPS